MSEEEFYSRAINLDDLGKICDVLEKNNKPDNIQYGVCERCGTTKNVSYVVDPYDEEIHNITRWCWLCDSCYQEYCDDI